MAGTVRRLNAFVVTLTLLLAGLSVTTNIVMAETPAAGANPCSMTIQEPHHLMESDASGQVVCQDSGMAGCVFGPSHCTAVVALPADTRHSPVRTTTDVAATTHRAFYTNPVAEISTPPPNTLS